MSGGSVRHSLIIANLGGELRQRLKGTPCQTYDSNLRVRSPRPPTYSYPDVTVICGEPLIDPEDLRGESVTNPCLIAEVLSPSTQGYDRGQKFIQYLSIDLLREYLVMEQDQPHVELHFRGADGAWSFRYAVGLDASIELPSIGVSLPLRDIYERVKFPDRFDEHG